MMNLVFRCMAQDKPKQPHDYAAERKRNDRKPPRPPKGVTVRLGELGGLSAEFAIKRERFSTFTAADLLLLPCGSGGQSASISQPTTVITRDFQLPPCTGKSVVCLFGGLPDRLCRALENRRFPEGCRIHGGKRRRYAGVVISVAAEGKGISPAEALVSLSPCVTQADCFPSHTRNCGNRLRRPLCRISRACRFQKGRLPNKDSLSGI